MNEQPTLLAESPTVGVHASPCPAEELDPPIIRLPSEPSAGALATTNTALETSPINGILATGIRRKRNGKIARLGQDLRDMVNCMLRNNVSYAKIVKALAEYEITVTERNISNWKLCGGYKEWCLAQDHAVELRLHQDNMVALLRKDRASEVPEVGLQVAATRLSQFFLTPEAAQLLATNPEDYHRRAFLLSRLSAEIHKLQKYRDDCARGVGYKHDPERIRIENEDEIERTRKSYTSTIPDDIKLPSIPHRNYLPKE